MIDIRPAAESDLPATVDLINREIRDGVAHFGTREISLGEALAEWRRESDRYPRLVAIDQTTRELAGFARAGPWKSRGAYDWTVEVATYVAPAHQGRGLGKRLFERLLAELEAAGFRTVIAGIALPNRASVRLAESLGLRHVGTLPKVGYKAGAWHDVGYWACHLGDPDVNPRPR